MTIESISQLKQEPPLKTLPTGRDEEHIPFRILWKRHKVLYLVLIPAALLLIIFRIYPMWGIGIAFVDYNITQGLTASKWVGLAHFQEVFRRPETLGLIRNTVFISVGKILLGEIAGLTFALLINEVRFPPYRKFAQTVTTIPHFFSWVIVGALVVSILGSKGALNDLLGLIGIPRIRFLVDKTLFPFSLIFTDTWKEFGWSAVIYLAALTQLNPELLEAAAVDGAGRAARILHIILPTLIPVFIFMIALGLGSVLDAGMEQVLVLYNPAVYSTGDILDTYVYRIGLINFKWELATVVGVIKGVVGYIAIMTANWISGKVAHYRMF